MSKSLEDKVAEVRRGLNKQIRERAATMTATERADYARSLPTTFRHVVRERDAKPVLRHNPDFAALDAVWGLGPSARAVTRTPNQLIVDALAVPKPRAAVSPWSIAAPIPGRLYPRASAAVGRVTTLSPAASEMDARMGIAPATGHVERTRTQLTISVLR